VQNHSEFNSVFESTGSCSTILEDQQSIVRNMFVALERSEKGEWALWFVEKEPFDMRVRGMMKSCMLTQIQFARDLENPVKDQHL
jgi:hypothetical protein